MGRAAGLGGYQLYIERPGQAADNLVLHLEDVFHRLVESFRPQVRSGLGADQLDIHPQPIAAPLHRTFQRIADVQLRADLDNVDRFALEGEGGVAGDHETAVDPRQVRGQAFGHPVDEIFLLGVLRHIGERQDDDRQPRPPAGPPVLPRSQV